MSFPKHQQKYMLNVFLFFLVLLLWVYGLQTSDNRNCSYWYRFIPLNQPVIHACVKIVALILSSDYLLICWCSDFVISSTSFWILFYNQMSRGWAIIQLHNNVNKLSFEEVFMVPAEISKFQSSCPHVEYCSDQTQYFDD